MSGDPPPNLPVVRLIQIGEMAGPTLSLPADGVRNTGLVISGAAAGMTPEAIASGAIADAARQVWDWLRADKLRFGTSIGRGSDRISRGGESSSFPEARGDGP